MSNVPHAAAGYETSRDYDLLWRLALEGRRVVCFVDYRSFGSDERYRDVAQVRAFKGGIVEIGARGICYVGPWDKADHFRTACEGGHVEFIVPRADLPEVSHLGDSLAALDAEVRS